MKRACTIFLALLLCAALACPAAADCQVVIRPAYGAVGSFSEGLAPVLQNGRWGYIDESGTQVIAAQYDWAGSFAEGVAVVATAGESAGVSGYFLSLLHRDGTALPLVQPDPETGGTAAAFVSDLDSTDDWGCHDGVVKAGDYPYLPDGTLLQPTSGTESFTSPDKAFFDTYITCGPAVDGVIPMRAQSALLPESIVQCFYMDKSGAVTRVFPTAKTYGGENIYWVYAPDSGLTVCGVDSLTRTASGAEYHYAFGALDERGAWRIPAQYAGFRCLTDGTFFCDGLWTVMDTQGKFGALNTDGKTVIPFQYDFMLSFSQGYAAACRDGALFFLDTAGKRWDAQAPGGGTARLSAASLFNSQGFAVVYDAASRTAYCVSGTPEDGLLPMVPGSAQVGAQVYFPDFNFESGELPTGLFPGVDDLLAIREGDLWGFARLSLDGAAEEDSRCPFTDVAAGAYYYDAVLWAVEQGVTTGTTETTFSPAQTCTQAQILTFLWRAQGKPAAVSDAPYTDAAVGRGLYYDQALAWAWEAGVVTDAALKPSAPCSRADVVLYLWRLAGSPAVETDGFADVAADAPYARAVAWAVDQGVTTGTSQTTFSPTQTCTRGQIVTFLNRYFVKG